MSTFFKHPFWKSLQTVLCLIFTLLEFHRNSLCIHCIISLWISLFSLWIGNNFDKANLLKIIILGQLFDLDGKLKNWTSIKNQYDLLESKSFQRMQLVDALDTSWKQFIREQSTRLNKLSLSDYHRIKITKFILLVNFIVRNYIIFSF